jgi:hypothetical protein
MLVVVEVVVIMADLVREDLVVVEQEDLDQLHHKLEHQEPIPLVEEVVVVDPIVRLVVPVVPV